MSIQLDNGTGSNPVAEKKAQIENACSTAEEFCKNFYDRIDNKRHTIDKLYLGTATLSWNGNKIEGATAIQAFLLDKIPSKSSHRLLSMDAQPIASTFTGGQTTILVQVAGSVQYQNVKPKPFQQNFLLTAQGDYWKVATDTFRHQEHSTQNY